MGLSGKYDFPGLTKLGAAGVRSILAGSSFAWILKGGQLTDVFIEFAVAWLANKGLIVLNVGAINVEGYIDQKGFDSSFDEALKKITIAGGVDKLTPEQKRAIDDEVISAARRFIVISKDAQKPAPRYDESYSGG